MEIDKLKKWLDVAQQFKSDQFWNQIFDEKINSTTSGNQFSQNPLNTVRELFPKCDLYESDQELVVEAEIPGLTKEDLHITIQQQLLTIAGEFKSLNQNQKYYLKERVNRQFKKELTLPYPILMNKVKSEIRHGVLYIVMPFYRDDLENIPIAFDQTNSE
ncbi:Hsp20/alpha crystallin family protein [Neobacillus sp. MM2021_6]|uniref:Hsp20/alpha crystallin family protein n=1 Tax=Bacillaceae TaxID=186817 RepID=UPI00140B71B5|nr:MULTISPECIES: Hsp20/alpha crystallin family protein [Bacillaceae]MBO0958323.1 Hsp20/alpha crystallin family protein [Neobacillus sp. MM2021_6]NHC17923.1 Hsp20/alpha crystallin family protein [Bacillus sp. MM2020_4]